MSTLAELRTWSELALQLPAALRPRRCAAVTETTPGGRWPVLLVHGYAGTDGVWTPLREALGTAGFGRIVRIRYNSVLSDPTAVSTVIARAALDALIDSGAPGVHLVGHSLGGLLVRHAVEHDDFLATRTRTAVTIATPHRGAPLARLAPGACRRSLVAGQAGGLTRATRRVQWLAYYSDGDRVVPCASARLDDPSRRVSNVLVPSVGHLAICRDARLIRSLVTALVACESAVSTPAFAASRPPSQLATPAAHTTAA